MAKAVVKKTNVTETAVKLEKEPAKKSAAKASTKPAANAPKKEEKPAVKTTAKKEPKVVKPEVSSAVAPKEKKEGKAVYHLKKREKDGKWEVLRRGGEKAIKLFDTKAEAEEYCKQMAENQGGTLLVHASKGKNKGKFIK
jgi:hypothetical protein